MRALLIDDDMTFRTGLAANLRFDGHDVVEFSEPSRLPPVDQLKGVRVLITDYQMPRENGLAVADRFHADYPGVPIILVTAFFSPALARQLESRPFIHLVQKPIEYHDFHRLLMSLTNPGAS